MVQISIIMPVYNAERFLAEAVDSVRAQERVDWELIMVDDGSTDRTLTIAERYCAQEPQRIRLLTQKNQGPGAARNAGMRQAGGRYLAFLDADDVWCRDKLARQAAVLDSDPEIGLVYCDNYFIDENRNLIPGFVRTVRLHRGRVARELFCHYFIMTSGVVLRREMAARVGDFRQDIRVGEDYDYYLRFAARYVVELIDEKLYEKRTIDTSLSGRSYGINARNDIMILKQFVSKNPEFRKANADVIRNRLGTYQLSLGYQLIRQGERREAVRYLLSAVRYLPSPKAFRTLATAFIPPGMARCLKDILRKKFRFPADADGEDL